MKNINRILSLVLTACMLCSMLPVMTISVSATTTTVTNEAQFMDALEDPSIDTIILNGTIFISAGTVTDDALVIPRAVTIQGGELSLRRAGIVLGDAVTFKDTSIYFQNSVRNAIIANGYPLTLDSVSDSGSPYSVHLFCGGISNYFASNTDEIPQTGSDGRITIRGANNALGDIYAGSLSDVGNNSADSPNTYSGAATITIESDASGTIGSIYACGAREDRSGSPGTFGNTFIPSADKYQCTGNVTINLNNPLVKSIYGRTGGTADAAVVYTDNGRGNLFSPLLNGIGSLSLHPAAGGSKANLKPLSGSSFSSKGGAVSLPANTQLSFANLSDLSIASLSGGGTLVLDTAQTLNITGGVTGTTKVAVDDVNFDGTASTGTVTQDHTYITASQSTEGSFSLLPSANFPTLTLTNDGNGNWSVPQSGPSTIIVDRISMSDATAPASNTGVKIPVDVVYSSTGSDYLSFVPFTVLINNKVASKTGDDDSGYTYTSGPTTSDIQLYFGLDERDSTKEVLVVSDYGYQTGTVPVGTYEITFTIPKENMASGAPHTFTITLTVGDSAPALQKNTITAVSGGISRTYNGTAFALSNQKGTHFTWNGNGAASIEGYYIDQGTTRTTTVNSGAAGDGQAPVNAGSYYAKVTVAADSTYAQTTAYVPFSITQAALTNAEVTINSTHTYNGQEHIPTITVKLDGKTLTKDTDYTVSASNNVNAGTATVKVTGTGNYSGEKSAEFTIKARPITITADDKTALVGGTPPTSYGYTITTGSLAPGHSFSTEPVSSCAGVNMNTEDEYEIAVNGGVIKDNNGSGADVTANYAITYVNGTLTVTAHQHVWAYTASGATLTATCERPNECAIDTDTITIKAPADLVYNSIPKTATLDGSIDGVTNPEIKYCCTGGCVNAGRHTASITLGSATASLRFTITKASRTITAPTLSGTAGVNSVTLTAVTPAPGNGDGTVQYGWSMTNDATSVKNWQTGLTFIGLTKSTTYYFFTRVTIGTNYADATSTWTEITTATPVYTVTFNSMGGSAIESQSVEDGRTAAEPTMVRTRSESGAIYRFGGWHTSTDGGKTLSYEEYDFSKPITADLTLYAKWVEQHEASGTITGQPGVTYTNIKANLIALGGIPIPITLGTPMTDAQNCLVYPFQITVDAGQYNLVVTATDANANKEITATLLGDLSSSNKKENITLPESTKNSVVEGFETTGVIVGGLNEIAAVSTVPAGAESITVTLTVEKWAENEVPSIEAQQIAEVARGQTIDTYLDIGLWRQVNRSSGSDPKTNIGDSNSQILQLLIPADTNKKNITVYRVHNGKPEAMGRGSGNARDGEYFDYKVGDGYIIIYAKRFSTYAVGYTEAGVHTITLNPNGGTLSGSATAITNNDGYLNPLPAALTRSGYTFNGWYTAADGGTKITTVFPFESDTTIYAQWTPIAAPSNPSGGGGGYTLPAVPISGGGGGGGYTSSTTTIPVSGDEDCPSAAFIDIDPNAWYHEAIDYVIENGLMNGYGDGVFGPGDDLSRGMLAQILYNLEGQPAVSGQMPYTDVAESRYYAAAIKWAAVNGIVGGYGGGLFGPDDSITREQLAVMLWRYAGSPAATNKELNFSDVDEASDWAMDALLWANENDVVNGYSDATLNPKDNASRSHVAQMLKNFLENLK